MRETSPEQPFYLQLDYTSPHGDFRKPAGPEPAPRNYDWFKGAPLPHNRGQGFDEGNVSDKPRFIREAPYLSLQDIHTYRVYWDKQLEAERSIDDGVKEMIDTLGSMHRLRNTYIIFTSDNGFFFGEHRLIGGKFLAYEPSTHLPFLIRGPGISPARNRTSWSATSTSRRRCSNWPAPKPTRASTGARWRPSSTTRNCSPSGPTSSSPSSKPTTSTKRARSPKRATRAAPRQRKRGKPVPELQQQKQRPGATASILAPPKDYEGIRLGPCKYIAWPDGEKELYDLERDPNELNNLARIPNYFPIRNFLHRELTERLENCVGRVCREEASEIPLTRRERQQLIRQKQEGTAGKAEGTARKKARALSPRRRLDYSIIASTSPLETAAPSATLRAVTLPERWAVISFSIFIASITQIRSPSSTSAPSSTATLSTVPCSGEGSDSLEARGAGAGLALALRAAACRRPRARRRRRPPRRSP